MRDWMIQTAVILHHCLMDLTCQHPSQNAHCYDDGEQMYS